jgi:hypothetical protein
LGATAEESGFDAEDGAAGWEVAAWGASEEAAVAAASRLKKWSW